MAASYCPNCVSQSHFRFKPCYIITWFVSRLAIVQNLSKIFEGQSENPNQPCFNVEKFHQKSHLSVLVTLLFSLLLLD